MTICGGVGNLKWKISFFFTQPYIFTFSHGIIGQQWGLAEKEWTKVAQLSQTEKERKTFLSKAARKNITKYVREKFRIVYLPSLSSLMNEFLVGRLCSAHLFIKIEKCVDAIHHSIWREFSLILYQTYNSPHWEIRYLRPDELHLRIFLKFGHNLERIEKVYIRYTISVYKGSQLPPKNKSWTFSSTFYITWFRIFFVWSW